MENEIPGKITVNKKGRPHMRHFGHMWEEKGKSKHHLNLKGRALAKKKDK